MVTMMLDKAFRPSRQVKKEINAAMMDEMKPMTGRIALLLVAMTAVGMLLWMGVSVHVG